VNQGKLSEEGREKELEGRSERAKLAPTSRERGLCFRRLIF